MLILMLLRLNGPMRRNVHLGPSESHGMRSTEINERTWTNAAHEQPLNSAPSTSHHANLDTTPPRRVVADWDPLVSFIDRFDDVRGWYSAWRDPVNVATWRSRDDAQRRPRLYYPAGHKYPSLSYEFFAVDGMGRALISSQPFECTIHPYTGKFERLCVQTRDSICRMRNSTWDRTPIRCSGPRLLLVALFPRQAIHKSKRWDVDKWDLRDWISVAARWIPASFGVLLLVCTGSPPKSGV